MTAAHLVPDFDRIAARVANPYSVLASLDGSDETVDSLAAMVARRAGVHGLHRRDADPRRVRVVTP